MRLSSVYPQSKDRIEARRPFPIFPVYVDVINMNAPPLKTEVYSPNFINEIKFHIRYRYGTQLPCA